MENLKIGNRKTLPAGKYVVTEFEDIKNSGDGKPYYMHKDTQSIVIEAAKEENLGKIVEVDGKQLVVVRMPFDSYASYPIKGKTTGRYVIRSSELMVVLPKEMCLTDDGYNLYLSAIGDLQFEATEDFECVLNGDTLELGEVVLEVTW